jgi:hypothetical protein
MKMSRFLQGAYRRALIIAAGGSLYLLSGCDESIRTSILTETGGVITSILDAILNTVIDSITGDVATT